ncbi:MAG: ParA family protein, partial [Planctomycetota bacterium]
MRTVAVANQKGGCAKTTTSVNLAAAYALAGKRVLLIDLDPQAHATIGLGQDPESLEQTIYNLFIDAGVSASMIAINSKVEKLSLLPSNILLSGVEFELASMEGREYVLSNRL